MSGDGVARPAPCVRRRRARELLLTVLFLAWMYGSAMLLLLGLLNQLAWMAFDGHTLTGRYYGAGLVLAAAASTIGLVIAAATGGGRWRRRFGAAVGCSLLALVLVGMAWSVTQHPRFAGGGSSESPEPPEPPPWRCYTRSGGTNTCPGG